MYSCTYNKFETKEYKPRNKLNQKIYMHMWYFTVRIIVQRK